MPGPGALQFEYNTLFFAATGLASDQTHVVKWGLKSTPAGNDAVQFALIDYAIVTSGEDSDLPSTGAVTNAGYVNFVCAHVRDIEI